MTTLLVSAPLGATEPAPRTCSLEPGRASHEIEVDGARRRYHVAVGSRARATGAAPLVFLWHGWGASGTSIQRVLDPDRDWPEAIVVAAEGLPRNFPGLPGPAKPGWQVAPEDHDGRDLRFFDAVLADTERRHCIDPTRTYSTGYSNGGYFSNLLGCVRSEQLAGIAPVSGGGPPDYATCGAPVPTLIQHGAWDEVVPFEVAMQSFAGWSRRNACDPAPEVRRSGCEASSGCDAAT